MSNIFNTETIEHNGTDYRIEYHVDDISDAPWDNSDGYGNVTRVNVNRCTGHIDKKPGQVVLYQGNRNEWSYLYDFADAVKIAKRDRWNAEPYDAPDAAVRAVNADMDFLRRWCANEWHYMGIVVFPLTEDGDELRSKSVSLWGIESCCEDYHKEVIQELLSEFETIGA